MLVSQDTASILASGFNAGLIAAFSIPAAIATAKRLFFRRAGDDPYRESEKLYEDEDGVATEESQSQTTAFWSRWLVLITSLMGFPVAIMYAILTTGPTSFGGVGGRVPYSWIAVGIWPFIILQASNTFLEHDYIQRFDSALLAASSCLNFGVTIFLEHQLGVLRSQPTDAVLTTLACVQGGLLLVAFLAFISIQRRPNVYKDGKLVDGQFTSSLLGKLFFSWAEPTLRFARKKKNVELDDLPKLSAYQRSQVMEDRFNARNSNARLWWNLVVMYWLPFAKQILFILVLSILQFGPQLAMFKLLQLLEARQYGENVTTQAWWWVFALAALMLASTVFESWLFFVIWADIGMPMRSLLSILVFSKATRRKDVKGTQKKKEAAVLEGQVVQAQQTVPSDQKGDDEGAQGVGKKGGAGNEDEEDDAAKSRQSTVNLVGVDAKRVSDFCSFIYLYPGVVIKLLVSFAFLHHLIGWKAMLAGLGAFAISMPFNILFSKWYNAAQGRLMTLRDAKLAVINEALQGIRQIKFSAIEQQWQEKIGEKRTAELKTQWDVFKYDTGLVSLWVFGPVMLSAVCLTVYTLINGELSPSVAFTTIAVLSQIEMTLAVLPELTADAIDAWVACNRIEQYLRAPERIPISTPSDKIRFKDVTVAWPADDQEEDPDRFSLKHLNISFPPKQLSVISGKTGAGKSLLLAAILGEVDKLSGTIYVPTPPSLDEQRDDRALPTNWIIDSSVAFVAQIPWIENATIKDNILFGLPYEQGRYRKTLQVCALEKDLDILPDGDMTDIGANGINLSGGQRWRVSFARAMYSRAGTLVLDDIFSAVDAHVGSQLFEDALTGELGVGRTRILVTHHVGLCLPKTDYLVHLSGGTVQYSGNPKALKNKGELDEILEEEDEAVHEREAEAAEGDGEEEPDNANGHLSANANDYGADLTKIVSHGSRLSTQVDDGEVDAKGKAQPKKYTEDEKRETGGIKLDIYWQYILQSGAAMVWIPLLLAYVGASAISLGRSYWVTIWTRSYKTESEHIFGPHYHSLLQVPASSNNSESLLAISTASSKETVWYWLSIYLALSMFVWVVGTLKYFMSFVASIKASRKLFAEMTFTILRTPLRWLDTVPVGRILNRFSSDFNTIDSRIAGNMGYFFYQALEMIAITVAGFLASPIMILFAPGLFGIALYIMHIYLGGAREVKRLESNARSPIFSDFGALLSGVTTVRAFGKTQTYIQRMYNRIDTHGSSFYHIWLFNRWMGFRHSVTGTAFAVAVAIVVVASGNIDAALAGFALNFALRYSMAILWTMRGYSNTEMDLNSAERVIEYTRLEIEDQSGNSPPAAWPTSGRLEVRGLVAGYAPDLPPVLQGLDFTVESGQRVGVVGRTGAGKSSLTLALFRFIHQREGTVLIDGLDVSKIKLHDLRSRLAIIPQDPVLFSSTVRSNLDPFSEHSDTELRTALHRVHLIEETGAVSRASGAATPRAQELETGQATTAAGGPGPSSTTAAVPSAGFNQDMQSDNKNIFSSLSSKVAEGGLNLSQGQRQLLCLARAIVSRPKLMVLDEATSAVDMTTDELIQRSIREEFEGSTLLVIAHRLSTIADFDKILVMSEGKAVEFGSPRDLMGLTDGVFRGMVEKSGEKEKLLGIIGGK